MIDVPLVIYKNGERKVIGEAAVHEDGKIEVKKFEGGANLGDVLKTGMVFGTSLRPFIEGAR